MNVLIGCECSQVVCSAFRSVGCNAFSCDIQACYGGKPEWHIQCDVLKVLPGNIDFFTCDGLKHSVGYWDLVIIHPPCTYISNAGACRMFKKLDDGSIQTNISRYIKMLDAVKFFYQIIDLVPSCTKLCIENPIPLKIAGLPIPTQHIEPYFWGEPLKKYTYLWLYNGLNKLIPDTYVKPVDCIPIVNASSRYPGLYNSSRLRSQTSNAIASAMAAQWGCC